MPIREGNIGSPGELIDLSKRNVSIKARNLTATGVSTFENVASMTIPTGETLNVVDPSGLKIGGVAVDATAAELNVLAGATPGMVAASKAMVADASGRFNLPSTTSIRVRDNQVPAVLTAAAVAGASTVTEVAISVKDGEGVLIAKPHVLDVWLSDDVDGEGLTATTASGTVQAKAASGTVLSAMVAKKALRVQTLKTGIFTLEITDTAKTAFKVVAQVSGVGLPTVVKTLVTGDYGA